jgi:aquaglyceroporin related protein
MVAPILGCTLGGFLYALMFFTGGGPINVPYMGLYRFTPGIDKSQYEDRRWDPEAAKKEQENAEA